MSEDQTIKVLTFYVKGSAAEPYKITFKKIGSNVMARCNCPASKSRFLCKHRISLLEGDDTNLVSNNADSISTLHEMVIDSDCAEPFTRLIQERDNLIQKGINLESRSVAAISYRLAREALKEAFND